MFTTASRRAAPDVSSNETLVEKTVYTTAETFPTILRRSEIVEVGTVKLTPLQTAIERTNRKTIELLGLEKKASTGESSIFTTLTQELMFAVDTTQETSVANYHNMLPKPPSASVETIEEVDKPHEIMMLENALKVALTDYALTIRRCLTLYTRPAQQATKADLSQRKSVLPDVSIES